MQNFFDNDTAKAVYYVYLYGGVTKAGEKLYLSQSAMSRRIQMAEERAGLQIFERDYHHFSPTKEGMRYIEACKQILHIGDAALKDAHAMIGSGKNEIRILSTPSLASTLIPRIIKGFNDKYPETLVRIKGSTDLPTILEADVLISPRIRNNEFLDQIKLYDMIQGIYGTQEYFDQFGIPETADDLDNHRLLTIDPTAYPNFQGINWILNYGVFGLRESRKSFMEFGSSDGKIQAMLSGYGLTTCSQLHLRLINAHDRAIRVLPQVKECAKGVYFIKNNKATPREDIDFLLETMQQNLGNFDLDLNYE